MTVSNLSICFAPTLMRGPDDNSLSMGEVKYSNVVTNTLIEKFDSIFNDPRMNHQPRQNEMTPSQTNPPMITQTPPIQQAHIRRQPAVYYNKYDEQFGLGIGWYHTNVIPYRTNRVLTLYACVADTDSELTFEPNEVITDGKYRHFILESRTNFQYV